MAARNVGVILARLRRISNRLAPEHYQAFTQFIDNISAAEFKSIARFLVR